MFSTEYLQNLIATLTTAENTEQIEALLSDITERNQFLESAGELVADGDNATFTLNASAGNDEYKKKFEDLQKKYVERFMSNTEKLETEETKEEIQNEENTEETADTIDSLFEKESEE